MLVPRRPRVLGAFGCAVTVRQVSAPEPLKVHKLVRKEPEARTCPRERLPAPPRPTRGAHPPRRSRGPLVTCKRPEPTLLSAPLRLCAVDLPYSPPVTAAGHLWSRGKSSELPSPSQVRAGLHGTGFATPRWPAAGAARLRRVGRSGECAPRGLPGFASLRLPTGPSTSSCVCCSCGSLLCEVLFSIFTHFSISVCVVYKGDRRPGLVFPQRLPGQCSEVSTSLRKEGDCR